MAAPSSPSHSATAYGKGPEATYVRNCFAARTALHHRHPPLGEAGGFAFCRGLPERAGVVAIPNAVFYDHREEGTPFVRFAFCKRTGVLADAAERLRKAFTH